MPTFSFFLKVTADGESLSTAYQNAKKRLYEESAKEVPPLISNPMLIQQTMDEIGGCAIEEDDL